MKTYFAPAEKASSEQLRHEINAISNSPIVNALMRSVSGLLAVVNDKRQILAVNDSLLAMLGIEDAGSVLGLRPGEAINCIHAHEPPHGCGTTRYCSSCGAAIAMVTCLADKGPVDQKCVATVRRNEQESDLCLKVHACPMEIEGLNFILLFLQDITAQERWASLERSFFHDLNNILASLIGANELLLLDAKEDSNTLPLEMRHLLGRLEKEIAIQRALVLADYRNYQAKLAPVSCEQLLLEAARSLTAHPAAKNKRLSLPEKIPAITINTDASLVNRILTNMLLNAFEASPEGEEIRLGFQEEQERVIFTVWNSEAIAAEAQLRIFQRHFSTKDGDGRGSGTFAMKLFGETFLHGAVDFVSSAEQGTTFRFAHPVCPGPPQPTEARKCS
ncbi:sensor histidine kinase [Thiovibrio sp. JS02]